MILNSTIAKVKEIADHYGYDLQLNQLMEECAELISAVNKFRRTVLILKDNEKTEMARASMVSEIADVEIMLLQIKYLLKITDEEVDSWKEFKINRTCDRISEEKEKNNGKNGTCGANAGSDN